MRTTIAVLLALAIGGTSRAAGPYPLNATWLIRECTARCVARDAKGALLCIDGDRNNSFADCSAAWIEPTTNLRSESLWIELFDGTHREGPDIHYGALAKMNRRTRAVATSPLLKSGPIPLDVPDTVLEADNGKTVLTVGLTDLHLVRPGFDGRAPRSMVNHPRREGQALYVQVYAVAERYLAVLVVKSDVSGDFASHWAFFEPSVPPRPDQGNR